MKSLKGKHTYNLKLVQVVESVYTLYDICDKIKYSKYYRQWFKLCKKL